jgi:hypothetical protein
MTTNKRLKKQPRSETFNVRRTLFICGGVALILLGIYAMIRPNVMMPAKRQELEIAGQKVEMETRRIVAVPRPLSGLVIVSGLGLILISFQKE